MDNVELFFGFPLEGSFLEKFQKVNPEVCSIFIQEDSDYLQKITMNHKSFIGKNIGKIADIDSLYLLQTHIFSVLKKLIPDYIFDNNSLVLFPFKNDK